MQFRSAVTPSFACSATRFMFILAGGVNSRHSSAEVARSIFARGENDVGLESCCFVILFLSLVCPHRYDLLFGVVRAEAYFVFAAEDIQYGIESERRGKLLKAFVRDTYRWALNNNKHAAAAKYGTLFSSATSSCMRILLSLPLSAEAISIRLPVNMRETLRSHAPKVPHTPSLRIIYWTRRYLPNHLITQRIHGRPTNRIP